MLCEDGSNVIKCCFFIDLCDEVCYDVGEAAEVDSDGVVLLGYT